MTEELIVFEENKVEVRKRLKDGRIDYLDLTSWSFQDRLFGFLLEERFFEWCGASYPTPRERENIPIWFLQACAIQMKLHRTAAFHQLDYVLRSGSILTRMRFNVGLKGGGFNEKNKKKREIAIHPDTGAPCGALFIVSMEPGYGGFPRGHPPRYWCKSQCGSTSPPAREAPGCLRSSRKSH